MKLLFEQFSGTYRKDDNVRKFENDGVYAPENSVSMYKMYSSYLTIVPNR